VEDNGTQYTGAPYNPPPNLQETRQRLDEQAVFGIVNSGLQVMPRFGALLSEEEIWQIVSYIYDTQGGLGTAQ
jgi:mono/diheme cytochrome c family protein